MTLYAWHEPEQSINNNKARATGRETLKGEGQPDITALKVSYYGSTSI